MHDRNFTRIGEYYSCTVLIFKKKNGNVSGVANHRPISLAKIMQTKPSRVFNDLICV